MAGATEPLVNVTEFLTWPGDGTARRYELVDGVPRPVGLTSDAHGTILASVGALLANHLCEHRPRNRVVAMPGVQPHIRADWNFRIPDLGVTCAPNQAGAVMMPKPVLLIEILSPGNEADTWDNIRNYSTIPTVREMMVIRSTRVEAEILVRDEAGNWPQNPTLIRADQRIRLSSVELAFAIEKAYANTHLAA